MKKESNMETELAGEKFLGCLMYIYILVII